MLSFCQCGIKHITHKRQMSAFIFFFHCSCGDVQMWAQLQKKKKKRASSVTVAFSEKWRASLFSSFWVDSSPSPFLYLWIYVAYEILLDSLVMTEWTKREKENLCSCRLLQREEESIVAICKMQEGRLILTGIVMCKLHLMLSEA